MKQFIKRILKRKEDKSDPIKAKDISTAPLPNLAIINERENDPNVKPRQFMVGSGQSTGMKRDLNEDSLFTLSISIGNSTWNQPMGIFIIADGMGGHHHGEIASDIAIRTVASSIISKLNLAIANTTQALDEPLQEILQNAVMEAQRSINKISPGSGTTLTAVLGLDQQMTIAHIGDSRAYTLHPEGRITAITRDHSVTHRLEELGQISSMDAKNHPQRNVLYRSLGIGENLEVDISTEPFPTPGYLMVCSDGLWGVIPDDEIHRIVYSNKSLEIACLELVKAANKAGGPDNISVILVQLTH